MRRPVTAGPALPSARDDRARIRTTVRARRRTEVEERARVRRRPRHRAVVLVCALGAALAVGVPAVLAFAPIYTLTSVRVVGASPVVAAAIETRLAPLTGRPLALVDTGDVRKALAAVPAVATYRFARLPPHTLQLVVVQRVPVAQVRAGGAWRTEDAAGVVLATGPRTPGLPVVQASGAAYAAAASALAALPPALAARVSTVTAASADTVQLQLAGGPRVLWGDADDAPAKASALAAALRHAAKHAALVDVSSPGLVRVR